MSNDLTVVEEDNRSLLEVLRDVHLTNIGQMDRTFEEQITDRIYLQDCIACWDVAKVDPPIREKVYTVLMEKYWLVGDTVVLKKKVVKEDKEHQLKPLLTHKTESAKLT